MKKELIKIGTKGSIFLRKNSPEILLGLGLITMIGGTIVACKATLKAHEVLDIADSERKKIEEARALASFTEYSDEEYNKDIRNVKIRSAVGMAKLYAPAVALNVMSMACFISSRNIMKSRHVLLLSTYNALSTQFNDYRSRVVSEHGKEVDYMYANGIYETVEETGEGKNKKKETIVTKTKGSEDVFRALFSEKTSKYWKPMPEYNKGHILSQQNMANDLLIRDGYIFLNDIRKMLGLDTIRAGQEFGYLYDGSTGGQIDFGVMYATDTEHERFITGESGDVTITFTGVEYILDKVK